MSSLTVSIPKEIPLLILSNEVLLPGMSMRIPITTPKKMQMVKTRLISHSTLSSIIIGILPRNPEKEIPEEENISALHRIGVAAVVVQVTGTNWPSPSYSLLVTGLCRFHLDGLLLTDPYVIIGKITQLDNLSIEDGGEHGDLVKIVDNFKEKLSHMLNNTSAFPNFPILKIKKMLESIPSHNLADFCASIVKTTFEEKVEILDAVDLTERFKKVLPLITRHIKGLQMIEKAKKHLKFDSVPFTRLMREPPEDLQENENDTLEEKIKAANLPEEVYKIAVRELSKLKKMSKYMPDYSVSRNYLELLAELPWNKTSVENIDIQQSRKDLDSDHYAMDKLKQRVLEFLAVRQLKNSLKGPILCFVGPPGVGKTSLGRSIAKTMGREFQRISLGGVCDQSDIRGHRRTYIGSMPGRIIQGLKSAGTKNPVFLLDEVDKMSPGTHGDPSAALLEVLDTEQNCNFVDHYVNVPFDLSQVMFIATANNLATVRPALRDRMEIINVPGYTHEEKLNIALKHLIPKQLDEHGLTVEDINILDGSIRDVISKYTREAGVRNLERKIAAICRSVAVTIAESKGNSVIRSSTVSIEPPSSLDGIVMHPPIKPIVIDEGAVEDILGPPLHDRSMLGQMGQPGLAMGLAWTSVGGEVLFVEAVKMDGEGQLILTGHLGNVMRESATLALNWVRANGGKYGLCDGADIMDGVDVHIHFPAGAVEKDGPSAGVTIVTVLMSLFLNQSVCSDVAMTGEVTLKGLVLPVGGIKEKVLAAHRAGVKRVILPDSCLKELAEIPINVQNDIEFIPVSCVDDVLQASFQGGLDMAKEMRKIVKSKL